MFLLVEPKSLTLSVGPSRGAPEASTVWSLPDSNVNDGTSRRQKSVFISPGSSPTRNGTCHVNNAAQRMSDGTSLTAGPVDSTEAARKSRTLPPLSNRHLTEHNTVPRVSTTVDGPGDMTAHGVAPKALSRHELTGTDLDIGSMVEFDIGAERHYGVIRWIGYLSDKKHVIVGIELVYITALLLVITNTPN